MPPAEFVAKFDDIVPDGAERIMRMAEARTTDRAKSERMLVEADVWATKVGMWIAGVLSAIALVGAVALIYSGHPWGVGLVTFPVAALIQSFLRREQIRE